MCGSVVFMVGLKVICTLPYSTIYYLIIYTVVLAINISDLTENLCSVFVYIKHVCIELNCIFVAGENGNPKGLYLQKRVHSIALAAVPSVLQQCMFGLPSNVKHLQ